MHPDFNGKNYSVPVPLCVPVHAERVGEGDSDHETAFFNLFLLQTSTRTRSNDPGARHTSYRSKSTKLDESDLVSDTHTATDDL